MVMIVDYLLWRLLQLLQVKLSPLSLSLTYLSLHHFVRNVICPKLESLIGILPQPDDDIEEAPDVLLHYHGEKIN